MCTRALVASLAFAFLLANASAAGPNLIQKKVQKPPDSDTVGSADPKDIITIPLMKQLVPVKRKEVVVSHKSAYFGNIHLGTPAQEFSVVFDTGSGQVIVPAERCQSPSCLIHRRYSTNKSSTAQDVDIDGSPVQDGGARDSVDIGFGKGEVTGEFATEDVCLGTPGDNVSAGKQKCIKGMKVVMAVEMSEEPFYAFAFDGVVGLGLSALSLDSSFNFFGMLTNQSTGLPHIGLFLADSDTDPSEMAVGGHNAARLLSPLQWAPVTHPDLGYWQIPIKGIKIGGKPIDYCDAGDCTGIVDTGTSHFGVPADLMSQFQESLSSWHAANESVDCRDAKGPEVQIEMEDFSMNLRTQDYARRLPFPYNNPISQYTSVCRPRIMRVALPAPLSKKMFILGEPVLRRYYTVFDWGEKKIGFGLANQAPPDDLVIMMQVGGCVRLTKRLPGTDVKVTLGEKRIGLKHAKEDPNDLVMMLQMSTGINLISGKDKVGFGTVDDEPSDFVVMLQLSSCTRVAKRAPNVGVEV